ncbi:MAG: FHA domain-containing protein [Acidobacteriota bacterium]
MKKTAQHGLSDPDPEEGTLLDARMARPRLTEGLVPPETGLFLRILDGLGAGRVFTFASGGVFLLGREGADLVLADPKASRKHAEISLFGPGRFFLRDLASTNGTFLNGRRVMDRCELHHQDRIRVGDTVMEFSVIEGSLPVARDHGA